MTILFNADEWCSRPASGASAPAMQDAASQFIQLAAMFTTRPELLKAGNTVDVLLALRNRIGHLDLTLLGEEVTHAPFGRVATYHLKPRNVVSRGNELSAEVWFAPQLRFPSGAVRIRQTRTPSCRSRHLAPARDRGAVTSRHFMENRMSSSQHQFILVETAATVRARPASSR